MVTQTITGLFEMKRLGLHILFTTVALFSTGYAIAVGSEEPKPAEIEKTENTITFDALQADWVFSGIVNNENGERYHYYFQMQRKNSQFHTIAMLHNGENKDVFLFEESDTTIEHPENLNWHVGRTFMQFNPINNSWVFGVKTKAHKGFNFKIDTLKQTAYTPTTQHLRTGVGLLVTQTGRLNGHLQMGEGTKEQFVTAPKAWFKQIWVSKPQESLHSLVGVLCQFNDGSGFYSVNLQEPDALRGAVAGWRDDQGSPVSMSQFVSVKEKKDNVWQIHIPSPKVKLSIEDALATKNEKHQLVAGLTDEKMPGFCTISKDEVGQTQNDTTLASAMK